MSDGEHPRASSDDISSESLPSTDTWTEPPLLTIRQQKALLQLLQKGMSPAMACAEAGVLLDSARLTLALDLRFRRRCDPIPDTLTENVRAAIYSRAIKGTVTAQALWLKEEAARKAVRQPEDSLSPDELLAEVERISQVLKSLEAGSGPA